jgi:hypothetical protein
MDQVYRLLYQDLRDRGGISDQFNVHWTNGNKTRGEVRAGFPTTAAVHD